MESILSTQQLTKQFGGLTAVNKVDINIHEHTIFALIGPNGAGKTTFFNCLTGVTPSTSGQVVFKGNDITKCSQQDIVRAGICRTFQNLKVFKNLDVLTNVEIGMHSQSKGSWLDALLLNKQTRAEEKRIEEKAMYYLELLGLQDSAYENVTSLSYGDQRRVEIARALAAEPDLILLDEPAAGMNIAESLKLSEFIVWIRDSLKKTVLLIEHNMRVVMPIADFVVVLDHGEKICEGVPEIVQNSEKVIEAYLGRAYVEQVLNKGK